jgi:hypothetical protein
MKEREMSANVVVNVLPLQSHYFTFFCFFTFFLFDYEEDDLLFSGSLGQGLSVACGMAYAGKHFDKVRYGMYE